MKTSKLLTALVMFGLLAAGAQGARIPQDVQSNMTVAARDDDGWRANPNPYQYFDAERVVAEMNALPATRARVPGAEFALSNFLAYLNLPQVQQVADTRASTALAAKRISEPASELLMLVALGGLAIIVRRKMPE